MAENYTTSGDVDTALYSNNRWTDLTAGQKTAVIEAAQDAIDQYEFLYSGDRVSDGQDQAFPRAWTGYTFTTGPFTTTEQTQRLKRACIAQIEWVLARMEIGKAQQAIDESIRLYPQVFAELCPFANGILEVYKHH